MILKPRPMAEAPMNELLLLADPLRPKGWTMGEFTSGESKGHFTGFIPISDLLRAAEIVAAITPEGGELTGEFRCLKYGEIGLNLRGGRYYHEDHDESPHPFLVVRKLSPAVRYEYVTDGVARNVRAGDWLPLGVEPDEVWAEIKAAGIGNFPGKSLCFRRVEVRP